MIPKSNHILLQELDKPVSFLLIPPQARYRSKNFLSGLVTAIGPLVTQVKVGDEVAYARDLGTEMEHDGKKFIVILPTSIFAVK